MCQWQIELTGADFVKAKAFLSDMKNKLLNGEKFYDIDLKNTTPSPATSPTIIETNSIFNFDEDAQVYDDLLDLHLEANPTEQPDVSKIAMPKPRKPKGKPKGATLTVAGTPLIKPKNKSKKLK